ncbi:MAG: CopD family protein [bacterium]|nr:CopD family protein [bacterium]
MLALADFADGLLRGTVLVALAVLVGAVPWGLVVLRATRRAPDDPGARRAAGLVVGFAVVLAACQATLLGLKTVVLTSNVGPEAFGAFAHTLQFRGGAARLVLALAVIGIGLLLRAAPNDGRRWAALGLADLALLGAGAALVHAAGRLEHRGALMALTVLHQAAGIVWVGGLVQLVALGRLAQRDTRAAALWPDAVGRFARVAIAAVVLATLASLPLVWIYVGALGGLVGSGYGSLVVAKLALMGAALAFGARNFFAGRRRDGADGRRTPALVEAEALLLVTLVFTAAALASQPPSVDTPETQATPAELAEVFRPKWPTLTTPSIATKRAQTADPLAVVGNERTPTAYSWSNFSHNVAGVFLLVMSLLALLGTSRYARWARHWPLGLVALAVFVFLRASASDGTWPYGDVAPWSGDAEGLQHRIAALLALLLGLLEWRARAARDPGPLARLFPALAAFGGILLLTHAHVAFEGKSSYLVQVTHVVMGVLAVLLAAGRWLELRLPGRAGRIAGAASGVAMLLVALVLLFYREANVVVGPLPS